jgi:hypothetical protein
VGHLFSGWKGWGEKIASIGTPKYWLKAKASVRLGL